MVPLNSFWAGILFLDHALESLKEFSKNVDTRPHATLIKLESLGVESGYKRVLKLPR